MVCYTFPQLEGKLYKGRKGFFFNLLFKAVFPESTSDHKLLSLTSTFLFLINYFFDLVKNSSSFTFIYSFTNIY